MDRRKVRIAVVVIFIQTLIIVGVMFAMRGQYAGSLGYIDDAPWEMVPTATQRTILSTATKTLEPTPVLLELENCTYPSVVILNQISEIDEFEADVWFGQQKVTKEDAVSILNGDNGKIYRDLFFQLYTTKVNILLGVDATLIEIELFEAESWISKYDPEGTIDIDALKEAVELANTLKDFNNGSLGPGVCEGVAALIDVSATPNPLSLSTSTQTPGSQLTPTPSQTSSPTPTPSPTLTNTPYGVVRTSTPTLTPSKTEKPDKPTEEPNPTAQNTRVPPTDPPPTQPPPTDVPTVEPPPTDVPTEEPPPTIAPTDDPTPTLANP